MVFKNTLALICFSLMTILAGCASTGKYYEEVTGGAAGIVLAGQKAPEITGMLKSIETNDEVVFTVEGKDIIYRLSDKAKSQMKEIVLGSNVTFTTFSIGDNKETIAEFIVR